MKPDDLLKVIPCPIDFGDGSGPVRPPWVRYVRESDLRATLITGQKRVWTYTRKGERHRDIAKRQRTAKLQDAYDERHSWGMMHRSYLGTGALISKA